MHVSARWNSTSWARRPQNEEMADIYTYTPINNSLPGIFLFSLTKPSDLRSQISDVFKTRTLTRPTGRRISCNLVRRCYLSIYIYVLVYSAKRSILDHIGLAAGGTPSFAQCGREKYIVETWNNLYIIGNPTRCRYLPIRYCRYT